MRLLVLGVGSAVPTSNRHPSSQLLDVDGSYYLIDCGEGTQVRLRENKIRLQSIKCIFISHLHGDHYLGLMGLLWTMNLLGRNSILRLYGPEKIRELIQFHSDLSGGEFNYEIAFIPTDEVEFGEIHRDSKVSVESFPLDHKIFCTGFKFTETDKPLKIRPEQLEKYAVPNAVRKSLTQGKDYFDSTTGKTISNEEFTLAPKKPCSFAYCSDTKYTETILNSISNVDLLYHESTFLEGEKDKAFDKKHSTAREAGKIASQASVGKLLLGHYSNRYKDLELFRREAQQEFENIWLGVEGEWFDIC